MGYTSIYAKTERVPLKDSEWWVEIRQVLPKTDYDFAQNKLGLSDVQMKISDKGDSSTSANVVDYQTELVVRSIISWNLTDDNGNLLPLEPEDAKRRSIGLLTQGDFLTVYTRVNELNSPREAKESNSFQNGSGGGHSESSDAEPYSGPSLATPVAVDQVRVDVGNGGTPTMAGV